MSTSLNHLVYWFKIARFHSSLLIVPGYYRSNYDENNWERIINALSSGDQRLLGRTQLLDDAFALALSSPNALNYNITVRLALANLGNTLYKDWVPVQRGLRGLKDILLDLDIYTSYKVNCNNIMDMFDWWMIFVNL